MSDNGLNKNSSTIVYENNCVESYVYQRMKRDLKRENKLKCKEGWRNVLVCGITRIVWHQGFDQF